MTTSQAKQISDNIWDGLLPVNPLHILENLGHTTIPNESMAHPLEININNPIVVQYSLEHDINRQRYSQAYAVSFLFLNRLLQNNHNIVIDESYFQPDSPNFNKELNEFTLDILIPIHILKYVITQFGIVDVQQLSEVFGVTKNALIYQLERAKIN